MKPTSEWDLNHILQLPEGEFDWVEFKGRRALDVAVAGITEGKVLEELAKQLSAFANSGGGVLVYGITNPSDRNPKSVDDGGITIGCKFPNIREWLEDVIPNLVEFPLKKFNVYALTNKAGAPGLADDRCIIIVDIPDSEDAPHQSAREQKYYARVAGKSKPIGHRLVADIFHRGRHPIFHVQFAISSETWIPQAFPPIPVLQAKTKPVRGVTLGVGTMNRGRVLAKHLHFTLWLPERIVPVSHRDQDDLSVVDGVRYYVQKCDNRRRDEVGTDPLLGKRYGPPWLDPVLPSELRHWSFKCSSLLRPEHIKDEKLRWELSSDNAPMMTGEVKLRDIPFVVQDKHSADQLGADPYV